MARRGLGAAQEGYQKMLDAKRKKVENVMSTMTKSCAGCQVSSSKRRLFVLPEGDLCADCAAKNIPPGPKTVYELEAEHKAFLEAERNKPKPESYGGWA